MSIIMVIIGGLTRLTGSGLSIVNWQPITGILPPLNNTHWQDLFALYQQTPEFMQVNTTMDLAGFKKIFWLEYIHRVFGRLIGIVLLIPTIQIIIKRPLLQKYKNGILMLWALGFGQALLGWYMVESGLKDQPHVSPYFLVGHLSMAMLIIFNCLRYFFAKDDAVRPKLYPKLRKHSLIALKLVILTVIMGGFVAGNKAGLVYNTFPLMNGEFLPENMWALAPLWRNLFENHGFVQFLHRILAMVTVGFIWFLYFRHYQTRISPVLKRLLLGAMLLSGLQFMVGIATLLSMVHLHAAITHQALAFLLFSVVSLMRIRAS